MLVGGVLSHVPMGDSCLCSAQGSRGCSWRGCSHGPMSDPYLLQHPGCSCMLLDGMLYHGAHERSLPVQRTGCSWMLVDGVLSHGPMSDPHLCSAQGARGCSWMGCSTMDP